MINVSNLRKKYDDFVALDNFNMTVKKGAIYGLVGPNGAGKTTVLNHITGVYIPDFGDVKIEDESIFENIKIKEKIAYVPDDLKFFSSYTPNRAAKLYKGVYPKWNQKKYEEITTEFKLDKNKKISRMSKGMQKQAVFALTMSTTPDYLILDEPVDGLDPIVRRRVWQYIVEAAADRCMTTLVSSHNLKEMEGICDSIGIISKGRVIMESDLDELKSDVHKVQVSFVGRPAPDYKGLNILHREIRGGVELMVIRNNKDVIDKFADKYDPLIYDVLPLSLEEIFVYELGGELDESEQSIF